MRRGHSGRKGPSDWRPLALHLRRLVETLHHGDGAELDPTLSTLGARTTQVPGEYWLFKPGWYNLRWWWEEIIQASETARRSLIELRAYYVHERTLEMAHVTKPPYHDTKAFKTHLASVSEIFSSLSEVVSSRLYALREKIAWLVYEILTATQGLYIPPSRVSYATVCNKLNSIDAASPFASTLAALRDILLTMNDDHVQSFFRFRHGYVHRIQPRLGIPPSPLLLQNEKGVWDSVQVGRLRSRRLVHLASHTWLRLSAGIRHLAAIDLPQTGTICHGVGEAKFDAYCGIHSGVQTPTEYGTLTLTCMRECRGYSAQLRPDRALGTEEKDLADWGRRLSDIVLECIPFFEPEKHTGHFKNFIFGPASNPPEQCCVMLLTLEMAADPLSTTVVEGHNAVLRHQVKKHGALMGRDEAAHLVLQSEQFASWPEDAKEALVTVAVRGGDHIMPIARPNPEGKELVQQVVFKAAAPADLEVPGWPSSGRHNQFLVFGHAETIAEP